MGFGGGRGQGYGVWLILIQSLWAARPAGGPKVSELELTTPRNPLTPAPSKTCLDNMGVLHGDPAGVNVFYLKTKARIWR